MPRQLRLALGLAALALAFGPGPVVAPARAATPETATAAKHAQEHAEGGGDILERQPPLALFTVAVFLGLMLVLGKFAWGPLLKALQQREEHLEHVLTETERARNESEQLLTEHRKLLAQANDESRALIDQARRDAHTVADEIVRKARDEAEAERQRGKRDIETARDQALSEIWRRTADLAVSVAGKVLTRELNESDHQRLIATATNALPARANGHGGHG